MAEEALKKVEDQLNCLICLEICTEPKLLLCNHVFCRDCLEGLAGRNPHGLPCPTCRVITPIPPAGVAGLQPAFQTNYLLEIVCEHKKVKQDVLYCPQHHNRELELYCETCEELICLQCTIQQHNGHKYNLIGEVFEKHKQEITTSLKPAENQLQCVKEALEMVDACQKAVLEKSTTLQMEIRETTKHLHEEIDSRENELIYDLNSITQAKLGELALQREQVETTLAQLGSCLDMVKGNLRTGSQGKLIRMKAALVEQIEDLTSSFKPGILPVNTEADMTFSSSRAAAEACHAHGLVSAPTFPDPSQCYAVSDVTDVKTAGRNFTTLIQVNTHEGKPLEKSTNLIESELVSELTGTRTRRVVKQIELDHFDKLIPYRFGHKPTIKRRGEQGHHHEMRKMQGQYEVINQPTIKGRHQLNIKVVGEHIRGSPFEIIARSSVEEIGRKSAPVLTLGDLKAPWGAAINGTGQVVVTEQDGHCVTMFSTSGEKLRSFGTHGCDRGQFRGPRGVAVDSEDNILVVDCYNNRVQKFTAEGEFVTVSMGGVLSDDLTLERAMDIAVNAKTNEVFVVDHRHRVVVLNSDLAHSSTFGSEGDGKGEFSYPWGIACDSTTGNVYVADSGNNRIQVFTSKGKFLRMFGSHGRRTLNWPSGIAIDADMNVYVSEDHRISVFTSEGRFVTSFGREGLRLGELQFPRGVAVDSSTGMVYVCDFQNHRLQVF